MGRGMALASVVRRSSFLMFSLSLCSQVIPMTRVEGLEEVKLALKLASHLELQIEEFLHS